MENCIAIDGPCGSGKSAIAKIVAEKLSALYVDTGAMFRAIGFVCYKREVLFEESEQLTKLIKNLKLVYKKSDHESGVYIEIDGENLTDAIREHHVSELASKISKLPTVRTFLLDFQREIATENICVMEGRDIGTVVFPNSFCKIYLTADSKIRAKRRHLQLKEKGNCSMSYEEVLADVISRDERDMNRKVAPLRPACDAFSLDSSNLSLNKVVDIIIEIATDKASEAGLIL